MKPTFITSDGYPFWIQPNGSFADTPDGIDADMTWNNITEIREAINNGDIIAIWNIDNVSFSPVEIDPIRLSNVADTVFTIQQISRDSEMVIIDNLTRTVMNTELELDDFYGVISHYPAEIVLLTYGVIPPTCNNGPTCDCAALCAACNVDHFPITHYRGSELENN